MNLWNMPASVSEALRFQNEADFIGEDSAGANLLFIALRLLRQQGIGDAPTTPIPDEMFQRLNLNRDQASEAIATILESTVELNLMAKNLAA